MALGIAVDAMGGDHAPAAIVEGALQAAQRYQIPQLLVGDQAQIEPLLIQADSATRALITVHHASETIGMADPIEVIRSKRGASMIEAIRLAKERPDIGAAISAGNSGAFMAAGALMLGRIPGIFRPGFAVLLPGHGGPVVLVDAGAAVDCSAENLEQFAEMGHHLAQRILGIERPSIGLLNVGEEEKKGNAVTKTAFEYLRDSELHFIGNIEGDEVFERRAHVVVCDGFVGNVLLKTAEGVASRLLAAIREELTASTVTKVGALLARPAFRRVKRRFDWEEQAGGILLGVRGNLIVTHGKTSARGMLSAIRFASRVAEEGLATTIFEAMEREETPPPQHDHPPQPPS